MKNNTLNIKTALGALVLAALFMISGCQKDEDPVKKSNGIDVIQLSVGSGGSILAFNNWQHFESKVDELVAAMESHEDDFVDEWGHLNDDDLDDLEDSLEFNDQQPLVDFENLYSFHSLRQDYMVAEENWLNNEDLDTLNDPISDFFYLDEVEMTLLNSDAAVVIGDTIFIFTNDGYIEINELDFEAYNNYVGGSENPEVIEVNKRASTCIRAASKKDYKFPNSRMVRVSVRFVGYTNHGKSKAKIVNYKKKGSRWKRSRTNLKVASQNYFQDDDCSLHCSVYMSTSTKKRRSRSVRNRCWETASKQRIKQNSVTGTYWYHGTSTTLSIL